MIKLIKYGYITKSDLVISQTIAISVFERSESVTKNQEEFAGVKFETRLDDDGSIKDLTPRR
ncbi:MAG: hypothetical protein HDR84_00710 [Bacteroides sp.]|nr:hypothetical protein [Bacteroides sp.]